MKYRGELNVPHFITFKVSNKIQQVGIEYGIFKNKCEY